MPISHCIALCTDGIPVIDGLEFYPSWVYEPRGSPLHIFYAAKQQYIAELNDPIAQWSQATASGHDSWMGLWIYLEWVVALPILLFTVYRLGVQRRGTSGAHELALLVYAFHTALTTLTCIHDVFYWDNAVYTAAVKNKILYQAYSPWLIVRKCLSLSQSQNLTAQRPSCSSTWPGGFSDASTRRMRLWRKRRH